MANWFRIVAFWYVSKAGNDSNNTVSDPELPKATVQAGITAMLSASPSLAIGTGVFKEAISVALGSSTARTITGNGKVILRATGSNTFTITGSPSAINISNIEFQGYTFSGVPFNFANCTFKNCIFNSTNVISFTDCEFRTCSGSSAALRFTRCRIVDGSVFSGNAHTLTSSVVSATSNITVSSSTVGVNNCIFGNIRLNSGSYVDYNTFYATYSGTYPTLLLNTFRADPLWLSSTLGVYLVNRASPLIGTGENGVNIGNVSIGIYNPIVYENTGTPSGIALANPYSGNNPNVSVSGLVLNPDSVSVDTNGGNLVGERVSDWIPLDGGRLAGIGGYEPIGNLEFNKSLGGSHVENMNVPDTTHGATLGGAHQNPDRLTYELMFSNSISKPVSNAGGDNGGYWPAGTFKPFIYFDAAQIHMLGGVVKSNGETDFPYTDTTNIITLSARWVKVKECFRNNYTN